jgi:malonyl-CoA O-methyltransferase
MPELGAEVGARMMERLDYVRLAPRRVLDAGSGPARRALGKRYRGAQVVALDVSLAALRAGRPRFRLPGANPPALVCGDLARLPLAPASFDLVWSNLALHCVDEPGAAFREFQRVLAPEGLLMFSTLGLDTSKASAAAASGGRSPRLWDMHDLGDMLVALGFSDPVMDMEIVSLGSPPAAAEIVYGHAWKGAPRRTADGRAVVHFEASRRSAR